MECSGFQCNKGEFRHSSEGRGLDFLATGWCEQHVLDAKQLLLVWRESVKFLGYWYLPSRHAGYCGASAKRNPRH